LKFHGRVQPGRITDLATPLEVRIHQPKKATGVTIKIWELDAFIGADGKKKREGTPDDLLATFTGSIEPAQDGKRPPEWRKFVVDSVKIEDAPPDTLKFLLAFPGTDTTYEIPVISEADEVEGTDYELGFSIEVGGAEKFRTKVPCLLSPATVRPRVKEILIIGYDDQDEPILEHSEELPVGKYTVSVGAPPADFDENSTDVAMLDKQLEKVLQLMADPTGFLFAKDTKRADAGGLEQGHAITVRKGKKLRAFLGAPDAKPTASMAHEVAQDGSITVYRVDTTNHITFLVGGGTVEVEKRGSRQVAVYSGILEPSQTIEVGTLTLADED
jgi:hypothetical protein